MRGSQHCSDLNLILVLGPSHPFRGLHVISRITACIKLGHLLFLILLEMSMNYEFYEMRQIWKRKVNYGQPARRWSVLGIMVSVSLI